MQEAEVTMNAKIHDPIFHRVRDVAPNKVRTKSTLPFISHSIDLVCSVTTFL